MRPVNTLQDRGRAFTRSDSIGTVNVTLNANASRHIYVLSIAELVSYLVGDEEEAQLP